jgi:hypothetical protein
VSAVGHDWRAKFHRGQRVQFLSGSMCGNALQLRTFVGMTPVAESAR